jgi:hypothetical protein
MYRSLFSFCLRDYIKFGNDLDGSIRTGQFTGGTAGAGVFVVFIMQHHHFAPETF